MVVVLLIIIVCVLLFGKENTKSGILGLLGTLVIMGLIGSCMNALG